MRKIGIFTMFLLTVSLWSTQLIADQTGDCTAGEEFCENNNQTTTSTSTNTNTNNNTNTNTSTNTNTNTNTSTSTATNVENIRKGRKVLRIPLLSGAGTGVQIQN